MEYNGGAGWAEVHCGTRSLMLRDVAEGRAEYTLRGDRGRVTEERGTCDLGKLLELLGKLRDG